MKKPLNNKIKIDPPASTTKVTSKAEEKDKSFTSIPQPSSKRQKPIIPPASEVMSQNLHKKKAEELVQMKAIVDNEFKISVKTYAASHDMTLSDLIEKSLSFYMAAHP